MCGIAFMYDTTLSDHDEQAFKDLMVVTSLRGVDSTGVAAYYALGYSTNKDQYRPLVRYSKVKGSVYSLLHSKWWNQAARNSGPVRNRTTLIGHCRAATKGHKTSENAHPFNSGKITGVHNGTIVSGLEIPEGETDSQALYELIEKEGVESLSKVRGAYALVWIDEDKGKLFWLRNTERPLWFGWKGNCIVGSSEKAFLELLAARGYNISGITECKPFTLYSCNISSTFSTKAERITEEDMKDVLEPKVFRTQIGAWRGTNHSNFQREYGDDYWNGSFWREKDEQEGAKRGQEEEEIGGIKGVYLRGLPKTWISHSALGLHLANGCSVCGCQEDEGSYTYWRRSDAGTLEYICSSCVDIENWSGESGVLDAFPGVVEDLAKYNGTIINL